MSPVSSGLSILLVVGGSVLLGALLGLAARLVVPELRWRRRARELARSDSIESDDFESYHFELDALETTADSMPFALDPPPGLLEALRNGECILYAGAALGTIAGAPDYATVLGALLERTGHMYSQDMAENLRANLEDGETELVTELLAPRVPPLMIAETLGEFQFGVGELEKDELLYLISKLPFSGVLTDMWSPMPDWLFSRRDPTVITPGGRADLGHLLRSEAFFVAHLQGTVEQPDTLRMSWQEYRMTLLEDREFERFIASIDSARSLLFLGADVRNIEQLFQASDLHRRGDREHFALAPWRPGLDLRAQSLYDRFGVRISFYDPADDKNGLTRFVEQLHKGAVRDRQEKRNRAPSLPPVIQAVRLENIGPFESLELPLHPRTSVLLGDNASGKSSVLRAISLALSGEGPEVDRAARGLLRAGSQAGRIELQMEKDKCHSVLRRDGAGVSVRAEQLSPVAAGLWLALGFPPLRGAPSAPLDGPSDDSYTAPSALDVFPLAGDEVDDRIGNVQQWVVNTALRADERSRAGQSCRHMLNTFFAIVAELTPGLDFTFDSIDRRTWQVMVRTNDGILSIDQLSRGMTAMFSWVGVLLQRLFELYGDDQGSRRDERGALVLIDEVDLHLHPEWQRRILPLVGHHFPNVQLIASTHSPLVVGSLGDAQLVHLQRSKEGISHELLKADFGGWRSDQILTGPAFDLPTSRDQATERTMQKYTELLSRGDDREKDQVREIAERLRIEVPRPQESESGRAAADLVRDSIRQRIDELPAESRDHLANEAERYLQELRTDVGGTDDPG